MNTLVRKVNLFKTPSLLSLNLNMNMNLKYFSSVFSKERMKLKKEEKRKVLEEEKLKLKVESVKAKEEKSVEVQTKLWSNPSLALQELKKFPQKFPNQMINMVIGLNIDPKKGNQVVRGIYKMPGGSNKIPKIMVFTSPPLHEIAKNAGADFIADEKTYKNIQEGIIDFDKTVCTLDTLPSLKNLGRILGPKNLMPSTKVGTACTADNLEKIIKELKLGSKEFKTDIYGQVNVPIGRYDYPDEKILSNIDSIMKTLQEKKPESIKGRYFLAAYINSYKHCLRIDLRALDPKSGSYFMLKK